ncbi:MAG: succinate dehydrogenase, hydrophobic membrane anchor protein [Gammaproteobacteria bacterium]|nr:succinate dehydrogenase, hydrophobic membrane anchor protein [Gammaproteobacteria bacterium]
MNYRSPLSLARGRGSAHNGTAHWLAQRLTALALIPLGLAAAVLFFWVMRTGYYEVIALMHRPWVLLFAVLLVGVVFWHGYLGLRVVIEDYMPPGRAFVFVTLAKFLSIALALLGIIAALMVGFGSL